MSGTSAGGAGSASASAGISIEAARPRLGDHPSESTTDSRANVFARAFPAIRVDADMLIMVGMVIASLTLRLIWLGDRPLHHDESLHATYSWYLMGRSNPEYHYDPMMHGPLQFHMMAFFYWIFGSSPFSARLWSVTAGTALVAAPWLLRRQLGRWPVFALMGMLAISPTTLYFSRFAREDMQFALFTFLMVATMIRYIADYADGSRYHYRWLYLFGVSTGMAYAAKESIYLNLAMLGAFMAIMIAIEIVRGYELVVPAAGFVVILAGIGVNHLFISVAGAALVGAFVVYAVATSSRSGLVTDAVRATPWTAWALAILPFVALFLLLYWPIGDPPSWAFIPGSNKVATTLDIPGQASKPFTYSTDGLFGGLQYWQAQQPVARGGQPWYYYLFLIPAYEWLVTLFGIVGAVYVVRKLRDFASILILSWTVASFLIYGWTSEKMPWNALHLVVPLSVLAAIGLVAAVTALRRWVRVLSIVAAVVCALFSTHNAFTLAYVNGASPVEYMVYVQTSPDVPKVVNEMDNIQSHLNGTLHVQVDNEDEWPWVFYLRDGGRFTTDAYPTKASDYGSPTQPVLLVSDANYQTLKNTLLGRYVAFHETLRWWNPEEYKTYAERRDLNTGALLPITTRAGYFLKDLVSPSTWSRIMQWEIQRKPFSPHAWDGDGNQVIFWFLVSKQDTQYLSPALQAQAQQQEQTIAAQNPFANLTKALSPVATLNASATSFSSVGPVALDAKGDTYVGDSTARQIVELSPAGAVLRKWGKAGDADGEFNGKYAPGIGGVAVAPNGNVYVTDTWNGRVQEFSPTGAFIRKWGQQNLEQTNLKNDDFYGPRGIAVGSDGTVYVADTGHKRIQVFDATGRFLRSIGQPGSAPGQLNEPSSVAVDASGHLFVADYWNARVQQFSGTGQYVSSFQVTSWQGGYDEPQIAVDTSGRVFVPDPVGARMLVYSSAGKPLFAWGGAQFSKPVSVVVDMTGQAHVADSGNNSITTFVEPR